MGNVKDGAAAKKEAAAAAKLKEKEAKAKALALKKEKEAKEKAAKDAAKLKEEKAKSAARAKAEAMRAKEKEKEAKVRAKAEAIARKKAERDTARAKDKAAKAEAKAALEPDWVEQLDEKGNLELVDRSKFPHEIQCDTPGCPNTRYVNTSGLVQVTKCKPCAKKDRRRRRSLINKDRNKKCKEIVRDALALDLFPADFIAKHGL